MWGSHIGSSSGSISLVEISRDALIWRNFLHSITSKNKQQNCQYLIHSLKNILKTVIFERNSVNVTVRSNFLLITETYPIPGLTFA